MKKFIHISIILIFVSALQAFAFTEGFESGTLDGARWSSSTDAIVDNSCFGTASGSYACRFMGTGASRQVTTISINSGSGNFTCRLILGNGISGSPGDCEPPDAPDEGVHFQYNNGSGWTDLTYVAPADLNYSGTWGTVTVSLPAGAIGCSVQFRIIQVLNSASGYDGWAIDDISIPEATSSTVTTQAITFLSITTTSATGNGNITATGGINASRRGICWNTTGSPTIYDNISEETDGSFGTGAFSEGMSSLNPNTKYYVKAYAENCLGISYGDEVSFTTLPLAPVCQLATNIHTFNLTANWTEQSEGPEDLNFTVQFSKFSDFTYPEDFANIPKNQLNQFISQCSTSVGTLENLKPNTMYYYRVISKNATGYGDWSCTQSPTTLYYPPRADSASHRDTTSFRAHWTPNVLDNVVNGTEPFTFNLYVDCSNYSCQFQPQSITTLFDDFSQSIYDAVPFDEGSAFGETFFTGSNPVNLNKASFYFLAWDNSNSVRYWIELWSTQSHAPNNKITTLNTGFVSDLPTSEGPALFEVSGLSVPLIANTEYAIVIRTDYSPGEFSYAFWWPYMDCNSSCVNGYGNWSTDNGLTWSTEPGNGIYPLMMKIEASDQFICTAEYHNIPSISNYYETPLNSLSPETHYDFWLTGTNVSGEGPVVSTNNFWTLSREPVRHARTFTAKTISATRIDLTFEKYSNIHDCDGYILIQRIGSYPDWLPTDGTGYTNHSNQGVDNTIAEIITDPNQTTLTLTNVSRGHHYYYKLVPFNWNGVNPHDGCSSPSVQTYNYMTNRTIPYADAEINPPSIRTGGVTNLTTNSATLGGVASSNGSLTTVRLEYGTTTSYGNNIYFDQSSLALNVDNLTMAKGITGLTSSTLYHFRVVGTNVVGTTNGLDQTFTTISEPNDGPTIQDYNITALNVRATSADLSWRRGNGTGSFVVVRLTNPIVDGDLPVSRRAYPTYSTTFNVAPTIGNAKIIQFGTSTLCYMTGLSPNSVYYIRVCAYNGNPSLGTGLFNRNPAANNPQRITTPRAKESDNSTEALAGSFSIGKIAPNPVIENLSFNLDVSSEQSFSIEVYDADGRLAMNYCQNQAFDIGTHIINMRMNNLVNGLYTLVVKTGADMALTKFVISK